MKLFTWFRWTAVKPDRVSGKYGVLTRDNKIVNGESVPGLWAFYPFYRSPSWNSYWNNHGGSVFISEDFKTILKATEKVIMKYRIRTWGRRLLLSAFILVLLAGISYWMYSTGNYQVPSFLQ